MKQWVADPVESLIVQAPRAFVASLLALVVDFCILELCLRALGMAAIPAVVVGYLAGSALQYVLCSVWVFSTARKSNAAGFVTFTILSLVGLGITWVVLLIAHDWAGVAVEMAKC